MCIVGEKHYFFRETEALLVGREYNENRWSDVTGENISNKIYVGS